MFSKLSAAAAASLIALAIPAQAETIGFEEVGMTFTDPPDYEYSYLSNQYRLNWGGGLQNISWVVSPSTSVWFSGPQAHSGTNFAWSNGGTDLSISGPPFSLSEFWVRSANTSNDISLVVTGFKDGDAVDSKTFTVNGTYQRITVSFDNIDSITFIPSATTNLLLDDFVLTLAVPEPARYIMLLAGLGVVGFWALRRKESDHFARAPSTEHPMAKGDAFQQARINFDDNDNPRGFREEIYPSYSRRHGADRQQRRVGGHV